jgi:inositol-pentakisphosphate 2-kinase
LSQIFHQSISDVSEGFAQAVVALLMSTPVLHILAKLQRTLDALDIEGLSQLWHKAQVESACKQGDTLVSTSPIGVSSPYLNMPEPSISDWEDFLDTYLTSHDKFDHSTPETANLRYYILAYLLSATLKDCSIMAGLNQTANRVTVIDLDPKSVDRLHKWEKLDKEIVETYSGINGKHCIDQMNVQ